MVQQPKLMLHHSFAHASPPRHRWLELQQPALRAAAEAQAVAARAPTAELTAKKTGNITAMFLLCHVFVLFDFLADRIVLFLRPFSK